MLIIGSHVSFTSSTQLLGSVEQALEYKSDTFMFYTGAPQNTMRSKINDALTEKGKSLMKENGIDIKNVIVHAPYIINLANAKEEDKYNFSIRFLKEEVARCEQLGVRYLVLHPGSHVGQGIDAGIDNIIYGLNEVNKENNSVIILLETMAGKGTEIGSNFSEIKRILDGVNDKEKVKVCIDTCHLNDSGYNVEEFDKVLEEFDKVVGIDNIKCVHVNDSKNINGARKDRHENLGFGSIGFESLLHVLYHPKLDNIPKILETPWVGEKPPYKEEIEMIRSKSFNENLKVILEEV